MKQLWFLTIRIHEVSLAELSDLPQLLSIYKAFTQKIDGS